MTGHGRIILNNGAFPTEIIGVITEEYFSVYVEPDGGASPRSFPWSIVREIIWDETTHIPDTDEPEHR
jgi:hypothetical protein